MSPKRIHLVLTFDVEQWDPHPREEAHRALIEALGGAPSTWFVAEDRTQSFVERYPATVRELLARGHELAAHVHFQRASFADMATDVRSATERLRNAGAACFSFRGGAHVLTDRLAEELVALGYRYDSSAVPGLVRRYHTHDGDTFAAYPHVWSARPFWWRPGLLELPTASFPLTRPVSFLRKRFRLPLLVHQAAAFRARIDELAALYPADDVPIVVIGHSFDVENSGAPDRSCLAGLTGALSSLRADPAIRLTTLAELGGDIASGKIEAGLRATPPPFVSAAAVRLTEGVTGLLEKPWFDRLLRKLVPRS